jgi:hypothetical protein
VRILPLEAACVDAMAPLHWKPKSGPSHRFAPAGQLATLCRYFSSSQFVQGRT